MFDISSLKRAEEDLARALSLEREASARLRSLDDLKNTFLQAVSHDLRTPLAAVLGSALTLERDDIRLEPDVERDLARRIAMNARKLQRLVTDLLDLDRLSRGLTEPNRTEVDLADVIRTVLAESETPNDREVTLELEATPAAVDVPKVERIVENLLVNAVRHTQEEAHVWTGSLRSTAGRSWWSRTTGRGCPRRIASASSAPSSAGRTPRRTPPGRGSG